MDKYRRWLIYQTIDCEDSCSHCQRTLLAAITLLVVARLDEKKTIENKNNGAPDCKRAITSNARASSKNQSPRIRICSYENQLYK